MAIHVSIDEATSRLSDLVDAAVNGEEVVLTDGRRPLVGLTPVKRANEPSVDERTNRTAR